MGILDKFAEHWVKNREADRKIREAQPKTTDEANERFAEEMGPKIHNILYTLREEVERYFRRPFEVPLDAFIPSEDAKMVFDAIVSLQSEISMRDILP